MSSSNRRILIVDDNDAIHADFKKILCPADPGSQSLDAKEAAIFGELSNEPVGSTFEVDFASQGQEALTLVCRAWNEGRPYQMAFMDVRMPPGWDGIETTLKIWEVDPYLQVVICTAYSDYSWKEVATKLNQPDRFVILKKPFDVVEVLQLANAMTEKWALLKQVEDRTRKLQESEKRYQFLADSMPGLVWTALPDGKLDYVNRRLQEFSGKKLSPGQNWDWRDILHPDDADESLGRWNKALETGNPFEAKYRLRRATDGSYRKHLTRAVPMHNHKGAVVHWVGISIDVEDVQATEADPVAA